MRYRPVAIVLFVAMTGFAPSYAEHISFQKQIAPLLQDHCLKCHSGPRPKSDLDLTNPEKMREGGASGPAVVPGKPAESPLIQMVTEKKMPPRKALAPEEIALLRRWVEEGAHWEGGALKVKIESKNRAGSDWWSLQPIRRPPIPTPANREWSANPVDAFVMSGLEHSRLSPNPIADRRTLIRRVTLDLTGLRPTSEEVADFVRDRAPDAYEKLVDRLLNSPAYGERWARHWLDVVRFAESHGYEMNTLRPNAWPYRDWVIRAFNRDLPFEQFVREQLAGDTVAGADELTQAATGFLVGGSHDLVGNQTEEGKRQQRSDDLFDMVSTTSTAFLGLTAGCARCHDHKFDPISQRDFYSLEAIFAGVEHADRPISGGDSRRRSAELATIRDRLNRLDRQIDSLEPLAIVSRLSKGTRPPVNPRRNVERFAPVAARFIRMTIAATNDGSQPCLDEIEVYSDDDPGTDLALASAGAKARASTELPNLAIHKIAHLNDGQHGNSHSWISNEPGKGWAQIELPKIARISRIVWGRDREQRFRDRLATDYRFEISTDGKDWTVVAGSSDRGDGYRPSMESQALIAERSSLQGKAASLEKPPSVYAGTFHTPDVTYLLKRGDAMQRGEVVTPTAIHGIGPSLTLRLDTPGPDRRRALAGWIADERNPLAARVMVNRVWQYHFGIGLVHTPSDFGVNGGRPSNPALLDWLAAEFRANGGRLKPIHRLIVLSRAYRQTSHIDVNQAKADADDRLLWRYPSRRIEAEAVRDTILQTTGSLNRRAGGPGYNLWTYSNYVTVFTPKSKLGPDEFRRMIYQFKPRTQQDRTFGAFDCPDATSVVPRRNTSTTALQALNLLNDGFMFDQADRLAARIRSRATTDVAQVRLAFSLAFQRPPSERELRAAASLVRESGLADFCRMLLNANEFVMLE